MRWYRAVGLSLMLVMLAVVGGLFLSSRTPVVKHVSQSSETEQPNMRIHNLHLTEQAEAGNEWELLAREAEFYDAKQRIVVHQLQAQLLSKEAHPIHVIADSDQIDSYTGSMTSKGNV